MATKEKDVLATEGAEFVVCKGEIPKQESAKEAHGNGRFAVEELSVRMFDDEALEKATAFFKIFGDKTRLRILLALEGKEICVHTMTHMLNINQTTLSHQLKILRDSGVVSCRRVEQHVFYRLKDGHIKAILDIAAEHIHE